MGWLRSLLPRLTAELALPFLSSVLQILSVFAVFRILILHEGPAILGVWSLTVGILGLTALLNLSGAAGLPRFLPQVAGDPAAQVRYIDTVTLFVLALFAGVALIGYLPLRWYIDAAVADDGLAAPRFFVTVMVAAFVLSMLANAGARALEGLYLARWRAGAEILGVVVFVAGSAMLAGDHGIGGVALARAAQFAVVVLIGRAVLVARVAGLPWVPRRFSRAAFREAMGLGSRIQAAALGETAFFAVTRILIEAFWGLAVLGVFEIAFRLMQSVYAVLQQTMAPLVARFAEDRARRGADPALLGAVLRRTAVLGALAYLAALAAAPAASLLLLDRVSPEFLAAAAALGPGWYAALLAMPAVYYARGAGRLRATIRGYWGICLLATAALIAAGRAGAGIGPSAALSLAMVAGYGALALGIARETGLPLRALYPPARLLAGFGAVAAGAGLLAVVAAS